MCFDGCDTGKRTMRLFVNKFVYAIVAVAMASSLTLAATYPPENVHKPEFAEAIPNVTVVVGRDVSLPCVIDNLGYFRVAWIHTDRYTLLTLMNRVMVRDSRYKVTHNGHRTWWLHISEVQERDKGEYACQINTSPMKIQTAYINVVVNPHIDERYTSPDKEVTEGSDVSLRCVANGHPDPEITWRRQDNQEITIDKETVHVLKGPYLNITNVTRLHTGTYLCTASNGIQPSANKSIELNVDFYPQIDERYTSSDKEVTEGNDVSLRCVANGYPDPEITWRRKDNQEITINKETVHVLKGPYLNITNVTRLHTGTYLCIASNGIQPAASKSIELNVKFAPMIWILEQRVGAPVHTDVYLDCNLQSFPQPVSHWYRDDGTILLTNKKYNIEVLTSGLCKWTSRLTITNLKPEDFGSYTCVAKNSLGEAGGSVRLYEIIHPSSTTTSQRPELVKEQSENDPPNNSPTEEEGPDSMSSTAANILYTCSYYVIYITLCQRLSFCALS